MNLSVTNKKHLNWRLVILLLVCNTSLLSQNIDSLRNEFQGYYQNEQWNEAKSSIDRILDMFSTEGQWDSIIKYNDLLYKLGVASDNLEWQLKGRLEKSSTQLYFKPRSKELLEERLSIFQQIDTTRLTPVFASALYESYHRLMGDQGNLDSALKLSRLSMHFGEKSGDPTQIVMSKMGHARNLITLHRYGEAIETLIQAEKVIANSYIDDIIQIRVYLKLAEALKWISDTEKAHFYADKAKLLAESRDYQMFVADANYQKGMVYLMEDNYRETEVITNKALQYYKQKKIAARMISCYKALAMNFFANKEYDKFDHVVRQLDSLGGNNSHFMQLLIGKRAVTENNFAKAKKIIDEFKTLANLSIHDQRSLMQLEYRYEQAIGNADEALIKFKQYVSFKDSIYESNQAAIAQRIESEYNRKQQDDQIESLEKIRQAQDKALAIRNTALVLGSMMLLILATLLYFLYNLFKKNQKIQLQLTEQNTQITAALQQNQMLIKEVHHRVKNNLQVVSSLLSMQERKVEDMDTKDALKSSKTRVQSMSILHQNLYSGENLTEIEANTYFNQLVTNIKDTYGLEDTINFSLQVDNINLDVDTLIPIGLILNELVTNAIKHAFSNQKERQIKVILKEEDNVITLKVEDNGDGLPEAALPRKTGSLGSRLINSFTQRLDGTLTVDNTNGTSIQIQFNKDKLI